MNVLNIEVSYYQNCNQQTKPKPVNLYTFLRSDKYRVTVNRIRAAKNKEHRELLKKALLPGITPSGIFSRRAEECLLQHSGLIALDIDRQHNTMSMEKIKSLVIALPYVAYCGLSVSGQGLWVLVPLAFPEHHKAHFNALVDDFAALGIILDPAPANVASFRFCSYDPDAYFYTTAIAYTKWKDEQVVPAGSYKPGTYSAPIQGNDWEKVETIVRKIEARGLDITSGYPNWFALLGSLATLGESGRDYAHRISRFYPKYSTRETDRQFSACLRMTTNLFSLGRLFEVAKGYGILYRE